MPSDSDDEDADQVTAVPNLPHISTQRDINVTDTVTATGTVTGCWHGGWEGIKLYTCLLYEERGPCCRQFAFQQIAAGRMGFLR